jgi:glycosyltransferase involved in cell wall biosynthesis
VLNAYSIVVPALNEEETIGEILCVLQNVTDDLIVVDGHSTDSTVAIARKYGARVVQDNGLGKGDAVRVGLAKARQPITVFVDADGSHDLNDIPTLVKPILSDQADLVMGSRMLGGSEELFGSIYEVARLMGSLAISLSINYRYGVRFTDYQNGFRAIRTEVGRSIGLTSNITTIEQEMAMRCLRYGYRVIEIPTHEYRRKGGSSKISVMRVAHIYIWNLVSNLIKPNKSRPSYDSSENSPLQNRISLSSSASSLSGPSSPSICPICNSPLDEGRKPSGGT